MKKFLFSFRALGLFCLVFFLFVLQANAQVLVNEDFEGGALPTDWSIQTNASDGGWLFGSASDLGSAYWTFADNGTLVTATNDDNCDCDKSADYLIMPPQDLSGISALTLSFDMNFPGGTYQGATEHAYIEYSTDGGNSWTQLMELPGSGDINWVAQSLDLSALAGIGSDVLIAFRYDDGGGWLFGFAVDNVLLYAPVALDVALSIDAPADPFGLVGDLIPISGTITNNGTDVIQTLDISWTDGSNTYTDNLSGLNLMPGNSMPFTHSASFPIPGLDQYTIEITALNPNGGMDGLNFNNTTSFSVKGLMFIPEKKVFAEEATGTWCGWCPRGAVFMDYMAENYEDSFVGVAVHNDDPMAISVYDDGQTSFPGFSGFPSVIFERDVIIDPADLETYYNDYLNRISPIAIEVNNATLDVATRELSIEGQAVFATSFADGDLSGAIILKEDGVTGTGSGYNQVNYYSGGGAGPMGGYEDLPDPVPASQMVYDDVARDILPGYAGAPGPDVAAGDTLPILETYDFPNNWDPRNMQVVIAAFDNTHNGKALNVDAADITIICPDNLDLSIQVNDASGSGTNDGSIIVVPGLGIAPFTYTLDGAEVSDIITNIPGGMYELIVTDNAGCSETVQVNVAPVAVRDIEGLQKFLLLPNPASDRVVLDLAFDQSVDLEVEIRDATGRLVYNRHIGQTSGGQYELELGNQAEGMYWVRLKVANQTRTQRLVLMR